MEITDRKALDDWLASKPESWRRVVEARSALRGVPMLHRATQKWLSRFALDPLRALIICWANYSIPTYDMTVARRTAADAAAAAGRNGTYAAARAATYAAALAAFDKVDYDIAAYAAAETNVWSAVSADCDWLSRHASVQDGVDRLAHQPLWLAQISASWQAEVAEFKRHLMEIDAGYAIWIDWFERRIRGEAASFDIPGDQYRLEDKAILVRLANADDADFWGKGATYVNETLQGWLDEARARAVRNLPDDTPVAITQDPLATTYGLNAKGQLDRLSLDAQERLRDLPGQRRLYEDIRAAAMALRGQGQMLGARVAGGLDRLIASMPEAFEASEVYPLWRDGNALRRLHRAHEMAPKDEPSEAGLDAGVAEELGGILDLFNNLAFADHGLRERDERRTAPQTRGDGAAQQAAGAPLIDAALAYPEIATAVALGDIRAERENEGLPGDDILADQARDQGNRTTGNWFAGLLSGALHIVRREGVLFGGHVTSVSRAGEGVIVAAVTGGLVSAFGPAVAFVVAHEQELRLFASLAYQGDSALRIIDYIVARVRAGR